MNPITVRSPGQVWDSGDESCRVYGVEVTLLWDPEYPLEVTIMNNASEEVVWHMPADVLSRYLSDPKPGLKSVKGADWAAGVQDGNAVFAFKPDIPPVYMTCRAIDALGFIGAVMAELAANHNEIQDAVEAAIEDEIASILGDAE